MSTQNLIILEPTSLEQINVFKAMAKPLKVKFEIKEKSYDPEFVEKIMESKRQIAEGNFTEVKRENLKTFIDGL